MNNRRNSLKRKPILFIIVFLVAFGLILFSMLLIGCKWYAYLILLIAAVALVLLSHTKKFWHGWRIAACWLLALAVAFSGLIYGRPDLKVSFLGTFVREGIRVAMQTPMLRGNGLFTVGEKFASKESSWKAPDGYSDKKYTLSKSNLEILQNNSEAHKNIIYQLHGGGFLISLTDQYRHFAVRYSKISGGADVASLNYRIAPENKHPAALEDTVEGWNYLLAKGYMPENIIVVGDSAGGNLALALVEKLRDEGKALPKAIICMSPWADLAGEGASHTYNLYNDPMFGIKRGTLKSENGGPPVYTGDTDLHDKYLSPLYGSFTGFPPMLLQVGTYEVLESDSITVYDKAIAAGVDAKLSKYHGMFHVFQLAGDYLPESRAAWAEISGFLTKQFR